MGEGRAEEHTDQRVIAAADMVVVPIGTALSPEEVGELGRQLDAARTLYGTEVADGHVWHLALSNPVGDRQLSDEEWAGVVRDAMSRLGFSEASGKAPCRWVAVRHGRSAGGHDHVHVAVSLVREDGTKASIWRDRVRMSELCAETERRLGLTVVDGRERGGLPGAGRAEVEASARRGRPEPERQTLARLVRGAAVASGGEAEFVRRLRGAGVIVRPRYREGGTAEVVGYSAGLAPAAGEGPVWFGGGRLARDLALPALRAGWSGSAEPGEEALAEWGGRRALDGPGREARQFAEAEWANAAGRVDLAVERLGGVPVGERARWAAVARETAGVFGAWSARVEAVAPGALARAASTLGWSAQGRELIGSPRWREPAARDFRGVASVVTQSAIGPGSATGWVLLMRSMMRTVEEIGRAHQARGEALQAARLARLVTVELRQLEARLQRQAAFVGARDAASEAQPESAGGPVTIGDLLDVSYPPLPLAGAGDVGLEEPAPRHWDEPGREPDLGLG
jgi:hypothetical protein